MAHLRNLALPKPDRREKSATPVDYTKLTLPKDSRIAEPKFRAHVRGLGCQAKKQSPHKHPRCERTAGTNYSPRPVIDFCHTPTGGAKKAMGRKVSDRGNGIGLCHPLAIEQETIGWQSFEKKYEIDARAIATEIAADYEKRFGKEQRR